MSKAISFGKGLVTGAAVSVGIWMLVDPPSKKQCKKLKKKTDALVSSLNDMIDDVFDH